MHSKKNKNRAIYKSKKQNFIFLFAKDIFKKLKVIKIYLNDRENYGIICKKYDDILDNNKYQIVHFILYCQMRFIEWEYKSVIEKYITFPINFPINLKLNTENKYNSFNSLLYLNNFIYYLLETNQTLENFIKESDINRVGYNISVITLNNKDYYTIYYVINKKKLEISKILFSNIYSVLSVNNYVKKLREFIIKNKDELIKKKFMTSIFVFNLENKINYDNKYIVVNKLYIPKCHLEISSSYDDVLVTHLLYKEILWNRPDHIAKYKDIFKQYRNIEQLEKDLKNANVSKNDFNDMIRSIKPLGFKTIKLYRKFMYDFAKIIINKIKNFIIKIYGSSTIFYSANPDKNSMFAYDGSDFDILIIPTENMDKYKPELEYLVSKTYDINMGLYITPVLCEFFGSDILNPFFKKWGPCSFAKPTDAEYTKINNVDIEKTILKRHISPYLSKITKYYYLDILKENKTCLSNFTMFINNGKTISYWDENNEYISKKLV